MFVRFIICQIHEFFVWVISGNILIFDRAELMSSLFRLCFLWRRYFANEYSYEYIEDFVLVMNNRIDWFFGLEMLETDYDEEILHWRVSRSIYSFWFCCIESSFTKSTDSNQFLEVFVQETFAVVFFQEWYSYEADVMNLNWLLFNVAALWLEIWNEIALSSAKTLFFRLIFAFEVDAISYSYHEFYCN